MYTAVIDTNIPLADFAPTFEDLEDRLAAAMGALEASGGLPDPSTITEADKDTAREIFVGAQLASDTTLRPPVVVYLQDS